jgi:hypothetical protein
MAKKSSLDPPRCMGCRYIALGMLKLARAAPALLAEEF